MPARPVLQSISFEDIVPLLVSTYQRGHLVPFIGAGMSAPKLALWKPFVLRLEKDAGIVPSHPSLDVRAQRAANAIRNNRGRGCFFTSLKEAIKGERFYSGLPPQTKALAAIYWPLAISTNYDDLYLSACRQNSDDMLSPVILGRSPADCKQVMSSLHGPFDRETIWHIQGFLGGQYPECDTVATIEPRRLANLRDELVIGHSEYRLVTNTAVHFRRCFGEVFRSRSFLFLGSSLSEEYFLNLFGEILELCGPSTVPHFAFMPNQSVDARFLAEQMNITVCPYDSWDELPRWLDRLKNAIEKPEARTTSWCTEIGDNCELEIVPHAPLPMPGPREAVAAVARRDEAGCPQFPESQPKELEAKFSGAPFPRNRHVVQSQQPGWYAVTGRDLKSKDPGDCDVVHTAVTELLNKVAGEYSVLHMHLPSAGGTVPPVYGFMETVRAFGNWNRKRQQRHPLKLILYVGSQVILNLTAHQIDVCELLTSGLTRFWTVVHPEGNKEPVRRALFCPTSTTKLGAVLKIVGIPPSKNWLVSLCPSPRQDHTLPANLSNAESLAGRSLRDIGVVFGSTLTIERTDLSWTADCLNTQAAEPRLRRVNSQRAHRA